MKLLLKLPDGPPERIEIAGDSALVGRAPHCDVVIPDRFEFVSKRHLKLLRGTVVVDLSTNGTFVDGRRVDGSVVLRGKPAQLGQSELSITVEDDEPSTAMINPPPIAETASADELREARRLLAEREQSLTSSRTAIARLEATVQELGREKARLAARVEELEQGPSEAEPQPPAGGSASAMLVFSLQKEIARLKRELGDKQAAPSPSPSPTPLPPQRAPQAPRSSPPPAPAASGLPWEQPPEPREAEQPELPVPTPSVAAGPVLNRLAELVQKDVEGVRGELGEPLDSYLTIEGFRFLRLVERVVTRLAGGLIHLYQLHTVVPGVQGNLRELLHATLERPASSSDREALLEYLRELGRWLVVALGAYRQAAEKFALKLKDELSEEGLTAKHPISGVRRFAGGSEAELWKRACQYLRELTPDIINERLDTFARESADELIDEEASDAFS